MATYNQSGSASLVKHLRDEHSRLYETLTSAELSALLSIDGRSASFLNKNDCAYLDSRFSVSSIIFANEIVLGESVLSGEIDPGLVFMVNAALLCCHAARSIGACNADTNVAPFGITGISLKEKTQFNDAHIIGAMGTRASQFMRESYIRTPSYDERGFNAEMQEKISSGKLSATMFSQLDEIFAEVGIFPLQKSRNLAVEIINAAMALSILCRVGLNRCLPLLYFDLECAGLLKKHQITCYADLEKFIFDQFWSGAYFSVVRGIRNLDYASEEGSMIVGSLYSNLLKYEGRA